MLVALLVSSYDPWSVWETLFIYVTAVNKKLNAVIREQLLLQNCRACSLIVTVQADCVDRINANAYHALSLLYVAAVKLMYGTCDLFVV
jgi:hypothetical protein